MAGAGTGTPVTVLGGRSLGVLASQLIADVQQELGDDNPPAQRWAEGLILRYLNDGVRALADAGLFSRRDIIVPTSGRATYELLAAPAEVRNVWHDGLLLQPANDTEIDDRARSAWRTEIGTPTHWLFDEFLWIWQAPAAGTPLTFGGTVPITEAQGLSVWGAGYWSAQSGSQIAHFLPGDGVCTNWGAAGNLWVEYAYWPETFDATDLVQRRLSGALIAYSVGKCLEDADGEQETKRQVRAMAEFEEAKRMLVAQRKKGGRVPTVQPDWASGMGSFETSTGRFDVRRI